MKIKPSWEIVLLVTAFLGLLLSNGKINSSFAKQIGNAKYINVLYKRFILYNHKLHIFYVIFENERKTGADFKSFRFVWISDGKISDNLTYLYEIEYFVEKL